MRGTNSQPAVGENCGRWIKSSFSGPTGGNCVEVAFLAGDQVAVRNSRDADGPALVFTRAEWDAFLRGARGGEFDASAAVSLFRELWRPGPESAARVHVRDDFRVRSPRLTTRAGRTRRP